MNVFFRRLLASALGVLFAFFILEGALALTSYISVVNRTMTTSKTSATSQIQRPYRILFLGNSHTVGAGVKSFESYPQVIQAFFDKFAPEQVGVFNGGILSANTSVIYENLDFFIDSFKPHLIVIMAGEPNIWNRYNYSEYLSSLNQTISNSELLISFLNQSRVLRWINTLPRMVDRLQMTEDQMEKHQAQMVVGKVSSYSLPSDLPPDEIGRFVEPLRFYIEKNRSHPPELSWRPLLHVMAEVELFRRKRIESGLQYLLTSIRHDPDTFDLKAYWFLKRLTPYVQEMKPNEAKLFKQVMSEATKLYPGDEHYQNLEKIFLYAFLPKRIDPQFIDLVKKELKTASYTPKGASLVARALMTEGKYQEAFEIFTKCAWAYPISMDGNIIQELTDMIKISPPEVKTQIEIFLAEYYREYPMEKGRFNVLSHQDLQNWISWDLERIILKSHEKNTPIVVQNYHWIRDRAEAPVLYEASRLAALRQKVPFIDTHKEFLAAIEEDGKNAETFFTDAFGANDSHPSAKGHRHISRIIYENLVDQGLLPDHLSHFPAAEFLTIPLE